MTFHSRGALSPTSPLFRGRTEELARLVQLCQGDVTAYVIVYGGRQTGKTSLLLQLERQLHGTVRVCRVDFQSMPGATAPQMYRFLAQQIAAVLPLTPTPDAVSDPPSLVQFLTQALGTAEVSRLVVLLDELGALPDAARDELGNVLRAMFYARLITPALAKLQIVLTGSIELHHLVVADVSTLHNICEEIYLGDLSTADAIALVADGLEPLGIPRADGEQVGQAIYAWVQGHPYLTQRLGHLLAQAHQRGDPFTTARLRATIDTVQRHDVLLRNLYTKLTEYQVWDAAHRMLTNPPRFSRLDDAMARLELLGLAKDVAGLWGARNPLLEMALRDWLGLEPLPEPPPRILLPGDPLPAWVPAMIEIPAGPFLMGSSAADTMAYDDEKPQHRLELPTYGIGKTPVTNAQFRPFVEGDGYTNPDYWTEAGWRWREKDKIIKPAYWDNTKWNGDDYPVVGISWFEAVAYCRWLAAQTGIPFRLPTEAEWEKAARGPDGRIWPWGNTWEDGRCNSQEAGKERTTPVGSYPNGASPYGVLDMAGNVWEWCATKWDKDYPYQIEDEWTDAYLAGDAGRMLRGGSFWGDQKLVRGAYRDDGLFFPSLRNENNGLRLARYSLPPTDGEE
jgi:formylglycine-generating enzyme required for sulfatase activity